MPKKAKELSVLAVSKLKKKGRHAVGGVDGLYLRIADKSRSWVFSFSMGIRINERGQEVPRRRYMGLGAYPEMSLAEAREKARDCRKMIRDGIDPVKERQNCKAEETKQAEQKITFADCAESVLAIKATELENPKHLAQWRTTLETYVYPSIGNKCINDVNKADILSILEPIWLIKNETASRIRGRVETVIDYAKARDYYTGDNPAAWKGCLKPLLALPSKVQNVKHHPALPYQKIGKFMTELRQCKGIAARALEFKILTATRPGEVFNSTWDEIDFDSCIWTIPRKRMKERKEHRVPLAPLTISILKTLPRIEGNNHIFPGKKDKGISNGAMIRVIERMGYENITPHGFRATFRDWAGETTHHPREVIEHALSHQLKDKAEAAYQRGDLLIKRTKLMADWADYCYNIINENS